MRPLTSEIFCPELPDPSETPAVPPDDLESSFQRLADLPKILSLLD